MDRLHAPGSGDSAAGSIRAGGEWSGVIRDGKVVLDVPIDWPDGTPIVVQPAARPPVCDHAHHGNAIIAGFGLSGRGVADFLDKRDCAYTIVDLNEATFGTQQSLGRKVIRGDVSDSNILKTAGVEHATLLALTIPDEKAVLRAIRAARESNPNLFIIARTTFVSSGLKAAQLGANEVIQSEQAVALQFYHCLKQWFAPVA